VDVVSLFIIHSSALTVYRSLGGECLTFAYFAGVFANFAVKSFLPQKPQMAKRRPSLW
jgi:hypothetical protein